MKPSTATPEPAPRKYHILLNGKLATDEEYNRIANAKPKQGRAVRGELHSNRGFSLMR